MEFLRCMSADYSMVLREMLTGDDLLPLLWLCKSGGVMKFEWARQLTADVARIRSVTSPLRNLKLKFPGFDRAVCIHCDSRQSPVDRDTDLSNRANLLAWMNLNGLEIFSICEAVLVMNAWPECRREAGAALSDFLEDANTKFIYFKRRYADTPSSSPDFMYMRVEVEAEICFTYRGLTGSLRLADQYDWSILHTQVWQQV